jgi:hypothetical protein
MTRDEFVDMLMAEYEKRQQLIALSEQRQAEEKSLVAEYKVDECNKKRNDLALKYANLAKKI